MMGLSAADLKILTYSCGIGEKILHVFPVGNRTAEMRESILLELL